MVNQKVSAYTILHLNDTEIPINYYLISNYQIYGEEKERQT